MSKKHLVILFLLSVALNVVGLIILFKNTKLVQEELSFRAREQKYPLLSKRILQDFPQDVLINFLPLRNELHAIADPYSSSFGFYFEYLPTGSSIGNNQNTEFYAASLFKVPVIMGYYHKKERTGEGDKIVTIQKSEIDKEFGDLWKKGAGAKISLDEAVKLALEDSDNTAAKVIADQVDDVDFQPVYQGLDINLTTGSKGALVTANNYGSVIKAIYFAAVISKDDSEKMLEYLAHSKYNDKLPSVIPGNIPVSHKIGNFVDQKMKKSDFTDCGIVYYPRRPYLLCMVSETDENTARDRMQTVSKAIYDYISSR